MKTITFESAIHGYLLAAGARHLSDHTLQDYMNTFKKFTAALPAKDIPLESITSQHVETFLREQHGLTNKTLLNYYVGLSAFWTWATREKLVSEHILHSIPAPKPEQRDIVPFTKTEITLIMASLKRSKPYTRPGKARSDHSINEWNAARNYAIILLLLDTGMRASELCEINLHQVDERNHRIHIMGKGAKERTLPFSPRTGQALWRYLATRDMTYGQRIFVSSTGGDFDRNDLLVTLKRIGDRAEVPGCNPHRFRHTFAIQFLRNGGDAYTLQAMLGHSTLEMVKNYLRLAQIDLDKAHRHASPVDNWRL
jgi:site-specific recombinase XerD